MSNEENNSFAQSDPDLFAELSRLADNSESFFKIILDAKGAKHAELLAFDPLEQASAQEFHAPSTADIRSENSADPETADFTDMDAEALTHNDEEPVSPLMNCCDQSPSASSQPEKNTELRTDITDSTANHVGLIESLNAWPEPLDGDQIMHDIVSTLKRYVVFSDPDDAVLVGFWCLGTYFMQIWNLWPRLLIQAPEFQCGKSVLLGLVEALSFRGMIASQATSAGITRVISHYKPTLCLDEADTWVRQDKKLNGILNSGHSRRSAYVLIAQQGKTADEAVSVLHVWTAIALAGIGQQKDTLTSRSIVINLRRKMAGESVEDYSEGVFDDLRDTRRRILRWSEDNAHSVHACKVTLPDGGGDRQRDNFRPLFRLAATLGGEWPERLEKIFQQINQRSEDIGVSASVSLLRDLMGLFRVAGDPPSMGTRRLITLLCAIEEAGWGNWKNNKPITTSHLAELLRPYGVKSVDCRTAGGVIKMLKLEDLREAYERYAAPR
jgi:putative DNA primase/helicase